MDNILADYHTHTIYSHGKGTVLDNVKVAKEKGLKEIAITDHGFDHMAFAVKRKKLPALKRDIIEAERQTGVKVYLGVEANIVSSKGDLDIKNDDYRYVEVLVAGFHKGVKNRNLKEFFCFLLGNIFANRFKKFSKKRIEINTNAYIQAVHKYPIDIISHLGLTAKVDVERVAQACAETNTYIELNGKRIHFSKEDVEKLLKTDVRFVVSSDAHIPANVANVELGMKVAKMYNIPLDRIDNLGGTINIKNKKLS